MKQSIAIIPARGGSKRIPGKNVKAFCGKPMIAYSIQAALDSGVFDEIMVSTDSAEIAQTAVSYGANVPFLRSDKTADDFATTSEVLLEVIDQYEKRKVSFTYACCIYPSAPFVTGAKLKTAMRELKKNPAHTVLPVVAFSYPPQRGMTVTDGYASLKWAQYRDCRSQDLEKLYHDCGQYYAFSIERLKQTKNIMSGNLLALVQPELEVQDIDTPQDWQLAELKYKLLLEKKIGEHTMDLYKKLEKDIYIIAEMSANHAGSLARAKEIIHAAKESGADCVKIQTYTPDTLTIDCDNPYFQINHGAWKGETLYHLYEQAYTPWEWQEALKKEAAGIGIDFFSTPFDNTAVDFLESIGIECYKIASFELVDLPLLSYVAAKGKPIILSTGMADLAEIDEAVHTIRRSGNNQIVLLRCASAYPAVTDEMHLKTMQNMSQVFGVPVGLSDHSMGSVGAVAAAALGASVIEKHFCLDRKIENPDAAFSMNPSEFCQMVKDVRQAKKAVGKIQYGTTRQEAENIAFRRSVFCIRDLKKGETLTEENIKIIRPGYGLKPKYFQEVLGQTALRDIKRGTPLQMDMIGRI